MTKDDLIAALAVCEKDKEGLLLKCQKLTRDLENCRAKALENVSSLKAILMSQEREVARLRGYLDRVSEEDRLRRNPPDVVTKTVQANPEPASYIYHEGASNFEQPWNRLEKKDDWWDL